MLGLAVALATGTLVGGCAAMLKPEPSRLRPADALVVLGNRPPVDEQGHVAPETARRVRRAVMLYERGLAPIVVMTGGPAPSGHVEARVMADYAQQLGVPEHAIALEPRARDTIGNARHSVALLRERLGKRRPKVIVVSSPFHLHRARKLFRCAGAEVQLGASDTPDSRRYRVGFTVYEYTVRLYYLFIDECARARGEPPERVDYSLVP